MWPFIRKTPKSSQIQDHELNDLRTFQKIYEVIVSDLNLDTLAQNITDIAAKYLSSIALVLTLVTDDKKNIYADTISSSQAASQVINLLGDKFKQLQPMDQDYTLTIKAIHTKQVYFTDSAVEAMSPPVDKRVAEVGQTLFNIKCFVIVPIILNGEAIGALLCGFQRPAKDITDHEVDLIKKYSNYIAYAIDRSKLYEREKRNVELLGSKNKELTSLYNLTNRIYQTLDPNEVAQNAVDALPQDEKLAGALIVVNDDNIMKVRSITRNQIIDQGLKIVGADILTRDYSKFDTDMNDPKHAHILGIRTMKENKVLMTNDLAEAFAPIVPKFLLPELKRIVGMKSVVTYPIGTHGKVMGAIGFLIKDKNSEDINENDFQLLNTYALQISIAMDNAQLFRQIEETSRKLEHSLEQVQELRRQERDMIDVMGHELRTPISIVRNALVMIDNQTKLPLEKQDVHKIARYNEMALESARREIRLIETLLSATKVDGNRVQFDFTKIDLVDVIHDGLAGGRPMAQEKGIEIVYHKPAEPIYVYADRVRIQEIMDNFLSNAIKYTLQGDVIITTSVDPKKGMAYVSVKDTGIGIAADDLKNLGHKFFRAKQYVYADNEERGDSSKLTNKVVRPGGTGLGLYVTFELIRLMNGERIIESEVGKGSTFTFGMPIYTDQPDQHIDQTFLLQHSQGTSDTSNNDTLLGPVTTAEKPKA